MRRDKKSQPAVWEGLKVVHPNAAGLDIALSEIWAAVPPERTAEPVRMFGTYTPDLAALADWLLACGVDPVAMEATGVYWIPVYELLEQRGLPGAGGQCAALEERARTQKRHPGLSVDSRSAQYRVAACLFPARGRDRGIARLSAPSWQPDRAPVGAYPAYAEGIAADERPADPGAYEHHWGDWYGHYPGDCGGRAELPCAGRVARPQGPQERGW